jgi:hypothetical protein
VFLAAIGAAAGLDTSNGSVLTCDILSKNWTEALFKYALGVPGQPTATQAGADYWWPDCESAHLLALTSTAAAQVLYGMS